MGRKILLKYLLRCLDGARARCAGALAHGTADDAETPTVGGQITRPVLEPSVVESLRQRAAKRGGDLIGSLAAFFRKDSVSRLEVMKRALGAGDAEELCRAAQTLTWTSSNIGATELSRCCMELEQVARAPRIDTAISVSLVSRIEEKLKEVLAALDRELRNPPPSWSMVQRG